MFLFFKAIFNFLLMLWTLRNKRYINKLLLVLLCENLFRLTWENAGSYSLVFAVLTSKARVRYALAGGDGSGSLSSSHRPLRRDVVAVSRDRSVTVYK